MQAQTFEEYRRQQEEAFGRYKAENTRAYEAYAQKEREGIEKLRHEVETYWGKNGFSMSTRKKWIDYSDDRQTRTGIDFAGGVAEVEILLAPADTANQQQVRREIQAAVSGLVFNTCTTYDYTEGRTTSTGVMEEPVLDGQLKTSGGEPVSVKNAEAFISEVSAPDQISYRPVEGADGRQRISATVRIRLIPEHVQVRAMKFSRHVSRQAGRFEMPQALIFAVIDTESSFNPLARSHIPAYGLMQIVPRFAGREAFQYLYQRDTLLAPDYLYQPDKNIELGTAYFDKLMSHYFRDVKNQQCRMLCAIAAYNTGARNVYRAFEDAPTKKDVIRRINAMNYPQLLDYLHQKLPSEETRNYVVKVDQKIRQYRQWQKNRE